MLTKQRKAKALNARLNYLVDSGLSAEQIKMQMNGFKVSINFIKNIIDKRMGQKC